METTLLLTGTWFFKIKTGGDRIACLGRGAQYDIIGVIVHVCAFVQNPYAAGAHHVGARKP